LRTQVEVKVEVEVKAEVGSKVKAEVEMPISALIRVHPWFTSGSCAICG
jgi:hypothetical protein